MSNVVNVKMHSDIANELYEILIHQPNPISSCDVCDTYHFQRSMTPQENNRGEVLDVCNDCRRYQYKSPGTIMGFKYTGTFGKPLELLSPTKQEDV